MAPLPSPPQTPAPPRKPHLETLPHELAHSILLYASTITTVSTSTITTLSALIHASPHFHAVYATSRQEYFTAATLNELRARGIDLLQPMSYAEIATYDNIHGGAPLTPGDQASQALIECHRQAQSARLIILSFAQCRALLGIADLVCYYVDRKDGQDTIYACGARRYDPMTGKKKKPVMVWTGETLVLPVEILVEGQDLIEVDNHVYDPGLWYRSVKFGGLGIILGKYEVSW